MTENIGHLERMRGWKDDSVVKSTNFLKLTPPRTPVPRALTLHRHQYTDGVHSYR